MASIPELPAVLTQGATIDEARTMIHSALRDRLEFYVLPGGRPARRDGAHSEPLDVVIGA